MAEVNTENRMADVNTENTESQMAEVNTEHQMADVNTENTESQMAEVNTNNTQDSDTENQMEVSPEESASTGQVEADASTGQVEASSSSSSSNTPASSGNFLKKFMHTAYDKMKIKKSKKHDKEEEDMDTTPPDSPDEYEEELLYELSRYLPPPVIRNIMRTKSKKDRRRILRTELPEPLIYHLERGMMQHPRFRSPHHLGSGLDRLFGLIDAPVKYKPDPSIPWTSPGDVSQTEQQDERQVPNNAGGFVYEITDIKRVRRFIVLGNISNTFYVTETESQTGGEDAVQRLLDLNRGEELVIELTKLSTEGRVAKQDTLIRVLAMCARQSKDFKAKRCAYKALKDICRTPTDLFKFVDLCSNMVEKNPDGAKVAKGWGRSHRYGIANWYLQFKDNPMKLAYLVTKYQQRHGWSHKDLLKLTHPNGSSERGSEGLAIVLKFIIKGNAIIQKFYGGDDIPHPIKKIVKYLDATEKIKPKTTAHAAEVCSMITEHRLVREHLPSQLMNSPTVWKTLLQGMPVYALIRNLGKLTQIGLLAQGAEDVATVVKKLTDQELLKKARIHPMKLLIAGRVYQQGHGELGSLKWQPNAAVTRALDEAFYLSFGAILPTNKRILLCIDISASMDWGNVNGCNLLKPRDAAAAMAMVMARTEPRCQKVAFSHTLTELPITNQMSLYEVIEMMKKMEFGGTDCSLPMMWAIEKQRLFDAFIIFTDSETHSGFTQPVTQLKLYRQRSKIPDAKLITVAMTSTKFSIADADDPNMLDVVGFDAEAPNIMRSFMMGEV